MQSWLPIPYRVVVIGGGLSGLSAAHALLKHSKIPCQVKIIESGSQVGGWLSSTRFEDGLVMEHGPRTARSYGPAAVQSLGILSELNIDEKIIGIPKEGPGKRRYIYSNGEICELPSSLVTRQKPFTKTLLSTVLRELWVKKSHAPDESIYDFFERRFGTELAAYASTAMCRGIFGGDAKKLSVKSCFPWLYNHEQRHGSVVKAELKEMIKSLNFLKTSKIKESDLVQKAKSGKWMAWTLKNGIQTLPELWSDHLKEAGVEILSNTQCKSISFKGDNKVDVITRQGTHECERVISAIPTFQLAQLIDPSSHSRLSESLNSITYNSMAVVTLQYKNIKLPVNGFGVLVPTCEPCDVLGITFDSLVIPQHSTPGSTVLTVMAGGAWFQQLFGSPDTADEDSIQELAVRSVRDMLGVAEPPCRVECRIQRDCIPQYELGHSDRVQVIDDYVSSNNLPLTIVGTHDGGVGVNDAIVNARDRTVRMLSSNHMR